MGLYSGSTCEDCGGLHSTGCEVHHYNRVEGHCSCTGVTEDLEHFFLVRVIEFAKEHITEQGARRAFYLHSLDHLYGVYEIEMPSGIPDTLPEDTIFKEAWRLYNE